MERRVSKIILSFIKLCEKYTKNNVAYGALQLILGKTLGKKISQAM